MHNSKTETAPFIVILIIIIFALQVSSAVAEWAYYWAFSYKRASFFINHYPHRLFFARATASQRLEDRPRSRNTHTETDTAGSLRFDRKREEEWERKEIIVIIIRMVIAAAGK